MLSTAECVELLKEDKICFGTSLELHCRKNILFVRTSGEEIPLSESQKRLLVCLFKRINCKRKIINIVWHEIHDRIKDNNYHQLIFQTRAVLARNGFPDNTLITLHYYGVKLNENIFTCSHKDIPRKRSGWSPLILIFKRMVRLLSRVKSR